MTTYRRVLNKIGITDKFGLLSPDKAFDLVNRFSQPCAHSGACATQLTALRDNYIGPRSFEPFEPTRTFVPVQQELVYQLKSFENVRDKKCPMLISKPISTKTLKFVNTEVVSSKQQLSAYGHQPSIPRGPARQLSQIKRVAVEERSLRLPSYAYDQAKRSK